MLITSRLVSHPQRLLLVLILVVFQFTLLSCGGGSSTGGPGTPPTNTPPPPPPSGDFSLVVEAPTVNIQQQGAYQLQSISASSLNSFKGKVDLTVAGLPSGVTIQPSNLASIPIAAGLVQGSVFQLVAAPNATIGTSTVTVTGNSGSLTHAVTFSLTVKPIAPFAIHVSPGSLSLAPTVEGTVQVSVTANAGTSPQLITDISSLPSNSGTNIFAPQMLLTPTTPVQFVVRPGTLAQPLQSFPLVVTATDNSTLNTSAVAVPLTVTRPTTPPITPTRSSYVRTDQNPGDIIYDQARKLIFATVETLNEVDVFSSIDGHRVATISVPYPGGIDESASGNAVYVVSPLVSNITTIDPDKLEVVRQTPLPKISGSSQTAFELAALNNGKVLIMMIDPTGPPVYLWDPTNNSFTGMGHFAAGQVTLRSRDHSKVLIYQSHSAGAFAFLYDVASNQFTGPVNVPGQYLAISPDGSQIIDVSIQNASTLFYDDQFNQVGSIPLDVFPADGVLYSYDGKQVYVLGSALLQSGPIADVIDTTTFSLKGIVPSFAFGSSLPFSGFVNFKLAIDENNMLFGPSSQGIALLDVSSPVFPDLPFPGFGTFNPVSLSLSSPTQTQLGGNFPSTSTYDIYFGAPPASPLAQKGTNVSSNSNGLSVTAPAGTKQGPANVTVSRFDGFFEILPDAVSYGPHILNIDANGGTSAGGDSVILTGYGFDGSSQVMFGGNLATNVNFLGPFTSGSIPSFAIGRLTVKTPAHGAGNVDVTITTPHGSDTVTDGFQYPSSVQLFPIAGGLSDIVYDQPRQLLYSSSADHDRIEIFDLQTHAYLSPIPVGHEPSVIKMTPDGALLAVLNFEEATISVINLSTKQVQATYPLLMQADVDCGGQPLDISPVKPHKMLLNVQCTGTLDGGTFRIIDLNSGSFSCTGLSVCASDGVTVNLNTTLAAMASIPDGSKVFFATDSLTGGPTGILDFTANKLTLGFSGSYGDAAASADGNDFAASLGIANLAVERTAILAYEPYAQGVRFNDVFGEKLNPSGSLLFMPQDSGVQIFDVHTGRLVRHISLADGLPIAVNVIALDETGTEMFLISNSGITIVQLEEVPLSLALPALASGTPGTQIKLRGSGFQQGVTVSFADTQATTSFVDQNTLLTNVPTVPPGSVRITVANPDGHTYSFDNAFRGAIVANFETILSDI